MTVLYISLLVLVAISVLAPFGSELLGIARKPVWKEKAEQVAPRLTLVVCEDRRTNQQPFVGVNRRVRAAAVEALRRAA